MSAIGHAAGEHDTLVCSGSRSRPRVLLLQSDLLPNLPLIESIAAAGFIVVGPLGSVVQAIEWIESDQPDMVILDMALSDGVSFELADELHRRKIPFLFYTSWGEREIHPIELRDICLLEKPAEFILMVKLLSNMIKSCQSA